MRILSPRTRRALGRAADRGGFTLIELLVVVGIIMIMTAMALPAINKFLKGQKLAQAGRLVQSAFNEARRAAITQRAPHYVFLCRKAGIGGNPDSYSVFTFRQGKGWETTEIQLPLGIVPVCTSDPAAAPAGTNFVQLPTSNLPVLDVTNGMPPLSGWFCDPTTITPKVSVLEFRKDGTLLPRNNAIDVIPSDPDLYDLNVPKDYEAPSTPADIILKQIGDTSKRCFIDVDINTGRVRFRVVETQQQSN